MLSIDAQVELVSRSVLSGNFDGMYQRGMSQQLPVTQFQFQKDQNIEDTQQNGTPNFMLNRGEMQKFPAGQMSSHPYVLGPTSILDEKQSYETFCQRHEIDNTFLDEKILIVDDQQINIMALKIILKLQGVNEMVTMLDLALID